MFERKARSTELNRLIGHEDWKLAQMECLARPRLASLWSVQHGFFDGQHDATVLPIHQACALQPTVEIIQALVVSHPQGVSEKESAYHRLPLHVAVRDCASAEIIRALLVYYPQAAQIPDDLGRTPLHYALSNGAPDIEIIDLLLETFEEATHISDTKGWLPLHVACACGVSESIVKRLLDTYPASAMSETKKGTTPAKCVRLFCKTDNADAILSMLEKKGVDPFQVLLKEHAERRRRSSSVRVATANAVHLIRTC